MFKPKRQPLPFGRFLLFDRISIGSGCECWKARLPDATYPGHILAVDRILPGMDESSIDAFIEDGKELVHLSHVNMAKLFDLGRIGEIYYSSSEYVFGRPLRALLDLSRKSRSRLSVAMTCHLMSQVADALDYAHRFKNPQNKSQGVIHSRLSPGHILISYDGEPKIIDFGARRAALTQAAIARMSLVRKGAVYLSPEQASGQPVDGRSDIFAVGAILHEMLTGEMLFLGGEDQGEIQRSKVTPPSALNAKVPAALDAVVLKALAVHPDDRFQHASELAAELRPFLATLDLEDNRKDVKSLMQAGFAEIIKRERASVADILAFRLPVPFRNPPPR